MAFEPRLRSRADAQIDVGEVFELIGFNDTEHALTLSDETKQPRHRQGQEKNIRPFIHSSNQQRHKNKTTRTQHNINIRDKHINKGNQQPEETKDMQAGTENIPLARKVLQ